MNWITRRLALPIVLSLAFAVQVGAQEVKRITILYDAFGVPSMLQKDWGGSPRWWSMAAGVSSLTLATTPRS